MRKFQKRRGVISTRLSEDEVELLASLVLQLVELVSDGEPEGFAAAPASADPFEQLVQSLETDPHPDEPEVSEDPVMRRLFPSAYPHDAAASSDFRRFTERELKSKKIVDAQAVLRALAETEGGARDLKVTPTDAESWLRTLTGVRLAVATRLGITDAESADALYSLPDEDPRTFMVSVYDWLGFAQETLVNAL